MRRSLGLRRVGHAGTLDPFASGLLVVLVGSATRLSHFLVGLPKQYVGSLRLGVETDTHDDTGRTVTECDDWRGLRDEEVAAAMRGFLGPSMQIAPRYSAKKIDGVAAHRRTRRGEVVALEPHPVEVRTFDLVERGGPDVHFACDVSSGTYVRALARDLGRALGCGAHLTALRRLRVGPLDIADAVAPEAVGAEVVRPALEAVAHLPMVEVDADGAADIAHGRPIRAGQGATGVTAVVQARRLIAVAEAGAGWLKPKVVLPA